jgi:hypothetical protein
LNASGGKVSASLEQLWRIVLRLAALLTLPLTVAVHPFKKPCIYNGFNNLNTDGHGFNFSKPVKAGIFADGTFQKSTRLRRGEIILNLVGRASPRAENKNGGAPQGAVRWGEDPMAAGRRRH